MQVQVLLPAPGWEVKTRSFFCGFLLIPKEEMRVERLSINVIIDQMIILFILMCLGYFLFKVKLIDDEFNTRLTKFVLYVTMPALIVNSVLNQTSRDVREALYVFLVAIVMFAVLPVVGWILAKVMRIPKEQQGMYIFMTIFSNIGFMGFPIMDALYGEKAVFYTAIFNLIFCLLVFTVGDSIMSYGSGVRTKFDAKALRTPGVVASAVAIVIYFLNVSPPPIVCDTISMVGELTTTLSMIVMGATLAKMELKTVFNDKNSYLFAALKQLALPLLLAPLLKRIIPNEYILSITLIMLSMPVASITVLLATEHGKDASLAAKNMFITTVVSMLTIPLILYLVF